MIDDTRPRVGVRSGQAGGRATVPLLPAIEIGRRRAGGTVSRRSRRQARGLYVLRADLACRRRNCLASDSPTKADVPRIRSRRQLVDFRFYRVIESRAEYRPRIPIGPVR